MGRFIAIFAPETGFEVMAQRDNHTQQYAI
jgi:hypothetical protein